MIQYLGKMTRIAGVFLLCLTLITNLCFAQEKHTISGYIKEASTGEDLIGANIYIQELFKGTSTNQYGFYSITVPEGDYTLRVSYLGFSDYSQKITLNKNFRVNIPLQNAAIVTEEIVIESEKPEENVKSGTMGTIGMEVQQIKALPALLGEVDVLKTIQLLPGVQTAGEGNSGFYVRGGGPDQNLILLDEAVVYNASHLFGFFSVFNADAIKNIKLIKGGMPANYGGRLASVLEISMKEGNSKQWQVEGGIGLISSRLTVQGPIKKDVSSFIISGRRTYADLFIPLFTKGEKGQAFKGTGYYFYDLNTKLNYILSDKDRLFLSGYFGRDVFNFNQGEDGFRTKVPWGNATTSIRWNHLFNDKLFMNTSLIFSDYDFSFEIGQSDFELKLFSGITDYNAKLDFSYYPTIRHNVKFGANYIFHEFTPSSASARQGEVEFDTGEIIRQYAHEGAFYINDEFDLTDRLKVNAGLRYSLFAHVGPFTRYRKDLLGNTTDTLYYKNNETIQTYSGLEPRMTVRYQLNNNSSVKAAYTFNYQYIHMATISGVSLPADLWVASSDIVKPQEGTQYAAGYFRNLMDNRYESSVELYYKTMLNMVEYKEGYLPGDNIMNNTDNNLTFGDGESYGIELFLKKRTGDLTGWVGYTLSKTTRTFEAINDGEPFPTKYDRRHDLSVVASYEIKRSASPVDSDTSQSKGGIKRWFKSKDWTFSGAFVFATGDAITLPVSRYVFEGNIVNEYGARNSFRMADYHRLDIGVTWKGKKRKRFESSWNLSVYNVYSRANPYFIYFDNEGDWDDGTLEIKAKQVSLFPILPSLTWNFKF